MKSRKISPEHEELCRKLSIAIKTSAVDNHTELFKACDAVIKSLSREIESLRETQGFLEELLERNDKTRRNAGD